MIDPEHIQSKIELVRREIENIDPGRFADEATRLRVAAQCDYCQMLIELLESLLS